MTDHAQALDDAQATLNRAVAAWARGRSPHEGDRTALDLYAAHQEFQMAAGLAFNEAAQSESAPKAASPRYFTGTPTAPAGWAINTTSYTPSYDVATEARIANLLAVVNYPHPIPSGDLVRKEAARRALQMLGLDNVPTTS